MQALSVVSPTAGTYPDISTGIRTSPGWAAATVRRCWSPVGRSTAGHHGRGDETTNEGASMNATRTLRRVGRLITALALVAGLSVATAGTAMAANVGDWACNYNSRSNTCLFIANLGDRRFSVHVGIDVYMSQQDAQSIINSGPGLSAALYGDDGHRVTDQFLTGIPLTAVWASSASGLSAEFDVVVDQWRLNEDSEPNDVDEIVAQVGLFVPGSHSVSFFRSGEVRSAF
jgi:hypothetical protein